MSELELLRKIADKAAYARRLERRFRRQDRRVDWAYRELDELLAARATGEGAK